MSNEKIRKLLQNLHEEVRKTKLDAETRASLQELDSGIHDLLDSSKTEPSADSVIEQAKLLEARFAVDYPTAERFLREVIDTLAKLGI